MKIIRTLLALVAISTAALTSCTTTQQQTAIDIASQTVDDLSARHRIDSELANNIKLGLEVVSRSDLSQADAATLLANARAAVSAAESAGVLTSDKALALRAGLSLAQLLFNQKAASRGHDSEFPKLSAIAAASQPPTPQPRVTMILTRREIAQARRADWLAISRVTDPHLRAC